MTNARMLTILKAIPSTEPATFYEFVGALGDDAPERGDKKGWWELFRDLEDLADSAVIEIERQATHIESLMLTEIGAATYRELS